MINSLRGIGLDLLENGAASVFDPNPTLSSVRVLPDESFTFGDRRTPASPRSAALLLQRHGTAQFIADLLSHTLVEHKHADHVAAILVGEGMAVQRGPNPTPLAVLGCAMGPRDLNVSLWVGAVAGSAAPRPPLSSLLSDKHVQ